MSGLIKSAFYMFFAFMIATSVTHAMDNKKRKEHPTKDLSEKTSRKILTPSPHIGLENWSGNSCYMNAIIQCITHCPSFMENCSNLEKNDSIIRTQFIKLINAMDESKASFINPNTFEKLAAHKYFEEQEEESTTPKSTTTDSQNPLSKSFFYSKISSFANSLSSNLLSFSKPNPFKPQDASVFFQFLVEDIPELKNICSFGIRSTLICNNYDHESITEQQEINYESILSVELDEDKKELCGISTCTTKFFAPEILTGANKFRCGECCIQENCNQPLCAIQGTCNRENAKRSGCKVLSLTKAPDVLVLQLKRFSFNRETLSANKDTTPFYLNDIAIKIIAGQQRNQFFYRLKGVVLHNGTLVNGHYTALVHQNPCENVEEWMLCNDSNISHGNDLFEELANKGTCAYGQPYMLFFEKEA